jgi:hypothetical protein
MQFVIDIPSLVSISIFDCRAIFAMTLIIDKPTFDAIVADNYFIREYHDDCL